ncbi:MAG TPA: glycosyltransferase family 2 protein [Azospirillaceae bacterium]|nr:glycosyltransferase family 2 protein [Azospirillaceae bacterium]
MTVAVVIPCYRVAGKVLSVIAGIGPEVDQIYVVDDACPEGSGALVQEKRQDPRVRVLFHEANQGVGGAMVTGFRAALAGGADIVVKLDGDGQMDPALIPTLIAPLLAGTADYAKGNRFFDLEGLAAMPAVRLVGNAVLSFFAKASTGYWSVMDPTNGFCAITATALRLVPLDKLSRGYFFETDLLFRLALVRAVVADVPFRAVYGDEVSSLRIHRVIGPFLAGHVRNFWKRIFYNYFLRGFSVASLELLVALPLILFGAVFGAVSWYRLEMTGGTATAGTVMLAALPIIVGVQMLLAFLNSDMQGEPSVPLGRQPQAVANAASRAARLRVMS